MNDAGSGVIVSPGEMDDARSVVLDAPNRMNDRGTGVIVSPRRRNDGRPVGG
jgi:hypothetical protein